MTVKSLEQIVNSTLNSKQSAAVKVKPKTDAIAYDYPVTAHELSFKLRDEPLRTITEVAAWIIAANTNQPAVTGRYRVLLNHNGGYFTFDDTPSIEITGLCGDKLRVYFKNHKICMVEYDGECIDCDSIMFHEGDFQVLQNGRMIEQILQIW